MKKLLTLITLLLICGLFACEQVNPPANGAVSTDVQVTEGDPNTGDNNDKDNDDDDDDN